MKKLLCLLLALSFFFPASALADDYEEEEGRSVAIDLLLYIPNRIFDLVDIFRVRARVGPGVAIGARATKYTDLYLGTYISAYAGLPGPRQSATIPLPIGLESRTGVAASLAEATVSGGMGPDYSDTEIGLGLHAGLVGLDLGIDPVEILDFVGGFVFFDLRSDDL